MLDPDREDPTIARAAVRPHHGGAFEHILAMDRKGRVVHRPGMAQARTTASATPFACCRTSCATRSNWTRWRVKWACRGRISSSCSANSGRDAEHLSQRAAHGAGDRPARRHARGGERDRPRSRLLLPGQLLPLLHRQRRLCRRASIAARCMSPTSSRPALPLLPTGGGFVRLSGMTNRRRAGLGLRKGETDLATLRQPTSGVEPGPAAAGGGPRMAGVRAVASGPRGIPPAASASS